MTATRYEELAELTQSLAAYRNYRELAQRRMDSAVAKENANIALESDRITETEARIRELVAELGLGVAPSGTP